MAATTRGTSRTARLPAPMKLGDHALNSRDFTAMNPVRHPSMIAHVPAADRS